MTDTVGTESLYKIHFGGETIAFHVAFRARSKLSITVHPDRQVEVVAPASCSIDQVLARVQKRAPWIARQRRYFEQFQPFPTPRRYVSGETHLYLGRQYRLKVVHDETEAVALRGRFIYVQATDRDNTDRIRLLLDKWYRQHAENIFRQRLQKCCERARRHGIPPPKLVVRNMAKRWGSCTRSGNVLLNTALVKAPLLCIEYVIMHELCHMKYLDHSDDFYKLLSACMPDWRRWKERLDTIAF